MGDAQPIAVELVAGIDGHAIRRYLATNPGAAPRSMAKGAGGNQLVGQIDVGADMAKVEQVAVGCGGRGAGAVAELLLARGKKTGASLAGSGAGGDRVAGGRK